MQCMKCGVGCPVVFSMDYNPTQIIRMSILGMKDEVLSSGTIWLCSGCETCTTRCPMEIDIAGVMDLLKEIAVEEGYQIPEANTYEFHDTFINIVRARGRMNEPLLFGHYKTRTKTFLNDMDLGTEMFLRGKIKYLGKIKGRDQIKKIIDKTRSGK
ncbi:MAG TPA: 4Fe-4S dicluster domain-containing protein [bacterium]|nr:4Fe-4S dicluster domain-containing protein [bacterium]